MGEEYNLGDRDGVILRDPGAVSEGGGGVRNGATKAISTEMTPLGL